MILHCTNERRQKENMDCPSKRRKSSFSGEEELRKMSRVWIQDTQGMNLQQQLVVPTGDHHMIHRLQQNEQTVAAPPLNMQQRAMAAIALQEIRSSIDPTKHLQQQQQNQQLLQKYHQQLVQQLKPVNSASIQPSLQPGNTPLLIDTRYTQTLPVLKQSGSSVETLTVMPPSPQLINMPVIFPTPSSAASLPVAPPAQPSSSLIPTSLRPLAKEHYPNSNSPNMVQDMKAPAPSNRSPSWFPQASYGQPGPGIFMNDFAERSGTGGNAIDQEQLQQIQSPELDPVSAYNNNIGTPAKVSSNMVVPTVYSNVNTGTKNKTQNQVLLDQAVSDSKNIAEKLDAQPHKIVPNNSSQPQQQQQQQRHPPTRTFTKVYKLGSIGRAVDVARFKNYAELRAELSRMFGLDGQLDQQSGWQLVFVDKENDLLLVGDDPWEEFVNSVRGIRILSPSEVSYYTSDERGGENV